LQTAPFKNTQRRLPSLAREMGETPMTATKARILCVDDQPSGLEGRKMLLEGCGYEVLIAASGVAALQLFSEYRFDLVLLDYCMPEMNGDLVADRMKAAQPDIPIVMLSAEQDLSETVLRSVDLFVSKTESPASLVGIIEDVLEMHPLFNPLSEFENAAEQAARLGSVLLNRNVNASTCGVLPFRR
jgi:CheY-like chemotaxis protein